jgi:hypothetical protein
MLPVCSKPVRGLRGQYHTRDVGGDLRDTERRDQYKVRNLGCGESAIELVLV